VDKKDIPALTLEVTVMSAKNHSARAYSRGEELLNTLSHGIGALLAAVGLLLMLIRALDRQDGWVLLSALVYGGSLLLLYSMSALYHGSTHPERRRVLRVMDHCSIFLLIAGSYTPYALLTLSHAGGPALLAVVWAIAVVGVLLNIWSVDRFHTLSQIGYLGMGWVVVFLIKPLVAALHPVGLGLLIAGGLFYTGGIVFYLVKRVPYFHSVWHFFVLAGSLCHFFSVYFYVL
jgi:hemolysin III